MSSRVGAGLLVVALTLAFFPQTAEAGSGVEIARFACFAKGGDDLSKRGGGPGGSHWNITDVRCVVELAWGEESPDSARVDLEFGQGRELTLVDRAFAVGPDRARDLAEPPAVARATKREMFIPGALLSSALKRSRRQKDTGAKVYAVSWVVSLSPVDARGRVGEAVRKQVEAELAFGE